YPFEAVSTMARIDAKAEEVVDYEVFLDAFYKGESNVEALAHSAAKLVLDYEVDAILADGIEAARALSKFHTKVPVIAIVANADEARSLAINFGVYPVLNMDAANDLIEAWGIEEGQFVLSVSKDSTRLLQVK